MTLKTLSGRVEGEEEEEEEEEKEEGFIQSMVTGGGVAGGLVDPKRCVVIISTFHKP